MKFISLNKGWTLIEFVLVIILIGLLSAVLLPKVLDLSDFNKKIAQEKLLFELRNFQKRAILQKRDIPLPWINNLKTDLIFHADGQITAPQSFFGNIRIIEQTGYIYAED